MKNIDIVFGITDHVPGDGDGVDWIALLAEDPDIGTTRSGVTPFFAGVVTTVLNGAAGDGDLGDRVCFVASRSGDIQQYIGGLGGCFIARHVSFNIASNELIQQLDSRNLILYYSLSVSSALSDRIARPSYSTTFSP